MEDCHLLTWVRFRKRRLLEKRRIRSSVLDILNLIYLFDIQVGNWVLPESLGDVHL